MLGLSACCFHYLPAELGTLTALRQIDLSRCSSLKELPGELVELKELQKIDLSGCRLLEKPLPDWVSALSELREIDHLVGMRVVEGASCGTLLAEGVAEGRSIGMRVVEGASCGAWYPV
jgi:hypothetical protein